MVGQAIAAAIIFVALGYISAKIVDKQFKNK